LLLPETAWWREAFIVELTSFPGGAHDDWCDALAMALNHLRERTGPSKYITAEKFRIAAASVRQGATVEEAAGCADIAAAELQDYLDRANRFSSQFAGFGAPPVPAPGKHETSGITLLVDASRAGHFVDLDPETYRLNLRTELKIILRTVKILKCGRQR